MMRFYAADAQGKDTIIRELRRTWLQDYRPPIDYWRQFRTALEAAIRSDHLLDAELIMQQLPASLDSRKLESYERAAAGFTKWLGRREVSVITKPEVQEHCQSGFCFRINPEWLVRVDGEEIVVKLHIRANERDALNKRKADPIVRLLQRYYQTKTAVIDVSSGKWWTSDTIRNPQKLDSAMAGQLAAFAAMWDLAADQSVA